MVVLYIYIYFYIFFYIYIYIYIYVYIRRACWTGSRVSQKSQKYPPKCFVRKLFTLLGKFSISGGRFFDFLGSKNIFNLCSNIELNTQNPNPILKNYSFLYKIQIWFFRFSNIFQHFENILAFLCFRKTNCNFEYRIRILCI